MKTLKESLIDDFDNQTKDLRRLQIEEWLKNNNFDTIARFTINKDYTIDIEHFDYSGKGNFPEYIQFNECELDFDCSSSDISSLRGCPYKVGGSFCCHGNDLKDLLGGPKEVGGSYKAFNNDLRTLKGSPEIIRIDFNVRNNSLNTLLGGPKKVEGNFRADENKLTSLLGGPKEVDKGYTVTHNNIRSLKGCPEKINDIFTIVGNDLKNLDYYPEEVNGEIRYSSNIDKHDWLKVSGDFLLRKVLSRGKSQSWDVKDHKFVE